MKSCTVRPLAVTSKERNAALQESEERFREFTRLSSDWLWQQDESLRFTKIDGAVQLGQLVVDLARRLEEQEETADDQDQVGILESG